MSNCFIGRTVLGDFNDFQLMRRFLFWSCVLPVASCRVIFLRWQRSAAVILGNDREAYGLWTEDGVLTITGEGPTPSREMEVLETRLGIRM